MICLAVTSSSLNLPNHLGAVMSEDIERAFSSGLDGHLSKPIDMQQLADMLRQWIPALVA